LIVAMCPNPTDIVGYTPQEMIGMTPFDLVHPDEREPLLEAR